MILPVLFILLAVVFFLLARLLKKSSNLPEGRIIYSDVKTWGEPPAEPLYNSSLGLAGKPDYLLRQAGTIIPVEVKSTRAPELPYEAHVMQLAAYCLLVEKVYRMPVPRGMIRYPRRTFAVEFTLELKDKVRELINEMHTLETRGSLARDHDEVSRCRACGYWESCDQTL